MTQIGATARSEHGVADPRQRTSLRWIALGLFTLQLAWILATPPFRGIDEIDHVYRAAAVADGEWSPPPTDATRGTGAVLTVPTHIVDAARPECEGLSYTKDEDCVGSSQGTSTLVASGAGRYNPIFYAVVGLPAAPFEGASAVYVMRLVTAAMCLALLLAAFTALRTWAQSIWPLVAMGLVLTPMVVYSTAVVAPNGPEIAAAAAVWAALMGLFRSPAPHRTTLLVAVGTAGGCLLVTLRSMGPLWALLIVLAVMVATPTPLARLRALLRLRAIWVGVLAVGLASLASLAWILSMRSLVIGTLSKEPDFSAGERAVLVGRAMALWMFQSIGSFPLRNDPAHPVVYASYGLAVAWLVLMGVRSSPRRVRLSVLAVATLALLIPAAITLATFDDFGIAWQGRYTIPFSMGFILLAALGLEGRSPPLRREVWLVVGLLLVTAHMVSPVAFQHSERSKSPGVANGDWILLPDVAIAILAAFGAAALWAGATGWTRATQRADAK